jgi:hypothetical protein
LNLIVGVANQIITHNKSHIYDTLRISNFLFDNIFLKNKFKCKNDLEKMPISIRKLDNLLASKGFVCKTFFTYEGFCVYIEVFSVQNASSFMLYVSPRYEMKIEERENVYELKYMEISREDENISNFYANEPDDVDIEEFYNSNEINFNNYNQQNSNLEKLLMEDYNKELSIKDINKDDTQNLKDIFRQLNRFMYCVQNIKYKLTIVYRNYLCSITKDNELDCFLILNYPRIDQRKLYIYIDLKTLYVKMDTFVNDIRTVKEGIYKLLNQNQIKHTKVLNDMLEQKITILQYSEKVQTKKEELSAYIREFENLLVNLTENEKSLYEKLDKVRGKNSEYGIKGLHDDIEKSHLSAHYEAELEKIQGVKQEIIENIIKLKTEQENITLKMDKILFDNSIMINEISKNFLKLAEIIS